VPMCACAAVQKLAAATRTAALFRELLDSMAPVEARDRAIYRIGGVAVTGDWGL